MTGRPRLLETAKRHASSSLTYATLDPRLRAVKIEGVDGYVAYKRAGKTLFSIGGPVCARKDVPALAMAFKETARGTGLRTAYFAVTLPMARALERVGYRKYRAAKDSWVDIPSFTTRGNVMMNVRRGYNRARNAGLEWSEYDPWAKRDRRLENACDRISHEWLEDKGGLEIQFILGRADWDVPGDRRFFVARSKRRVEGFLVYHPVYNMNSWYLDMSRRRMDSPNGTMDFLMVETLRLFKKEGAGRLYMGMIPDLTFPKGLEDTNVVTRGLVRSLAKRAEFFYPVRSETFFKDKYQPTWEELYMCVEGKISLGLLHDLLKAFQPMGVLGLLGRRMLHR